MIKTIKTGEPITWNPKNYLYGYSNSFNGTFSHDGLPISIMINQGKVIRANACHYEWSYPESVLWIKSDGSHGVSRVITYNKIPGYKDIVFAIGGVGISDFNPKAEGFCTFTRKNVFNGKEETKKFGDVLRRTNHSVFGFKGDKFFASVMYGHASEIKAECEKQGFTDVIMGDGGKFAAYNTNEQFNVWFRQYSAVQLKNAKDLDLVEKKQDFGKMKFEDGILVSYNKPFKIDLIPKSNKTSRPQYKLKPTSITIHNFGDDKKPKAERVSEYVDNAVDKYVSWHFTVGHFDGKLGVIQELPIDEVGWHATDGSKGKGNRTSLAIEIEENAESEEFAIQFIKDLMDCLGIDKIVPHKYWYPAKYCPRMILPHWEEFMDKITGTSVNYKELYEKAQSKLDKIKELL